VSFLAQSKQSRQSRRNVNSRTDFRRRTFLEQLEPRQVMATFTDFGGDIPLPPQTGGGDSGGTFYEQGLDRYDGATKIVASDPRVQAWQTWDFVNDSFLVRFQNWVTLPQAEATLASEAPGSSLLEWNDDLRTAWVSLPVDTTRQEVLDTSHHFLTLSNTLYAEPNFTRELRRVPNDPLYPLQWNMNNTGQLIPDGSFPALNGYAGFADADVDAPEAWDLTTGSPNTVVAILDSGYNRFEADMQPNYWVNPRETYNGLDDDGNGVIDDYNGYDSAMRDGDPQDDAVTEHGMNVASIVAAPGDDGIGMTGISWNSKLMMIKIEDDAGIITTGGVVGAIQYVTKMKQTFGINIVAANMSFGGPQYSFAEADALRVLGTKDVLIVAAAANQGYNHDILFDAPTGYPTDQIIAVTASNAYDEQNVLPYIPGGQPDFGYGAVNVDIAAPGIDVMLTGFRYVIPNTTFFTNLQVATGTSFAAPMVAGTAALMESLAPYLTAVEIKELIIANADPIAYMTNLNVADGRLNVFSALSAIPKTTISGTVFQDANNDKVQGIGELGLGGWTVYLDLDNDNVFDTGEPSTVTVTNTSTTTPPTGALTGTYSFDAYLDTGTYNVRQVVQAPFTQTTPTTNGGDYRITVSTRGQDFNGVNFGNRMAPGTIRGTKFLDLDADGTRDAGEPGLAGIMFFVDVNNNGRINVGEPAAVTGADGSFVIPNIQPGTYPVREILAGGYVPTLPATTTGLPVLPVIVASNTSTTPPLLFGNQVARDYGDLPESIPGVTDAYNTLSANGGPSHGILPGFMLGTRQDFETDGLPSISATGDDNNPTGSNSDEDGLPNGSQSVVLVQGQGGQINFVISNGGYSPGFLQAWIDFDADGSFAQAGDQILVNYVPQSGANSVTFALPPNATPGITYARLRYSHTRSLGPDGAAQDGEVEDYQLTIFSNAPIARPDRFPEQLFPPPNDPSFPADPLIKQESANNPLDVLRNDPLPVSGTLKILPGSFPTNVDGNVLTLDTSGPRDVLRFTPRGGANPFTGVYTFTYQVYDPTKYPADPLAVSTPATVQVLVTASDPRPVDNTFTMVGDVPSNPAPRPVSLTMDVLENDVFTPSAPIMVGSFTQPQYPVGVIITTPTVTRDATDPNLLVITPPTGFVGTVQFFYTVTDSDPSTVDGTAQVTVQVTNNPSPPAGPIDPQYLAALSLRIVDVRENVLGVDPGFRVDQGELFFVEVYSEDLRPAPPGTNADRGVEAAFLDLLYDKDLVSVNFSDWDPRTTDVVSAYLDFRAPVDGDPQLYDLDNNGILNSPEGVVNELGSARDERTTGGEPVGLGLKRVVRVGFNANTAGTIRFVADPAEDSQGRSDILLAGPVGGTEPILAPDELVFLVPAPSFTITGAGAPEFVNLSNAMDVNADQTINAFDAIIVINQLNLYGTRSLHSYNLGAAANEIPAYYVDVNGDGVVTAFDVIKIVNWLNLHPVPQHAGESTSGEEFAGTPESAGEFIPAVGSEGSEEESSSSGAVAPLLVSASSQGNSNSTPNERSSSPVANRSEDEGLLYLAAVDQLMAASSEKLTSAGRAEASPINWLELGSLAGSAVRKRFGLRTR
jgi:hypothetical protein